MVTIPNRDPYRFRHSVQNTNPAWGHGEKLESNRTFDIACLTGTFFSMFILITLKYNIYRAICKIITVQLDAVTQTEHPL